MKDFGEDNRRPAWHGQVQLWDDWACYLGPVSQQTFHAHVASQIALGLDEPVTVQTSLKVEVRGRAVLIAPLTRHRVAPISSQVLLIYADPRGRLGRRLRACATKSLLAVPEFGDKLLSLWDRTNGLPGEGLILTALDAICPESSPPPLDTRVQKALTIIEEQSGKHIGAIAESQVDLSAGRLRELAQKELGASLAHFSLWRKLQRSISAAISGLDLAEAAYAGGFADQAHMARTFRRMLGLTLTDLIRPMRPGQEPWPPCIETDELAGPKREPPSV